MHRAGNVIAKVASGGGPGQMLEEVAPNRVIELCPEPLAGR